MLLSFLLSVLCSCTLVQAASNSSRNSTGTQKIRRLAPHVVSSSVIDDIHAKHASQIAKPKSSARPVPAAVSFRPNTASKHANVTHGQVQSARALVAAAHATQSAYNLYRANNPRSNTYLSKKSAAAQAAKEKRSEGAVVEPTHSQEVLNAVMMLGDIDAIARLQNGTLIKKYAPHNNTGDHFHRSGGKLSKRNDFSKRVEEDPFWIPNVHGDSSYLGSSPYGGDSSYKVYRSVADYGAYGDGVTDDTAAINLAISDGHRCGINCLSSSVKPALVYFPLGTYRITSPLIMYYNTQLVGYLPNGGGSAVLAVDPNFLGFGVITSDVYLPGGASEWYIEQSNFYRQIRNFDIDLRAAQLSGINAIHWQVAQATSISNVAFLMTDKGSSTQIGIFAENGSGGWMNDLQFVGGQWGILGGNQQYTVRGAYFQNCANAIGMIWDWGWTWSQLHIIGCDIGINLAAPGASIGDPAGSLYLMDSDFVDTPTMIYTYPWLSTEQANTVITLDNIQMTAVSYVFGFTNGYVSTIDTSAPINFITIGDIEYGGTFYGAYDINVATRPAVLASSSVGFSFAQDGWFSRSKPSYYLQPWTIFFNAKWYAAGDGVTDDTYWIQAMLNYCAAQANCILYFPAGSYIITSTIVIPINSFIVGETWAQIVASGASFADPSVPTAAILVGYDDDVAGDIEIQDLLFTSQGNLPGLVLVLWNAKPATQGSVALWDTHFRVGGALGSNLQVAECPILSGGINYACSAAFAMMVVESSGYFENMWVWTADHDLDDAANTQVDVYVGRGILILGDGPDWFWGTASEHCTLYQYGIIGASNVFMSMIQTESPYQQGSANTQAPAPFDQLVSFLGDPVFNSCGSATTSCNNAWALNIQNSANIFINGAGLYSWFQNYNEDCVKTANCQQKMIYIYNTANLWLNHVVTIGAVEMLSPAASNTYNEIVLATANLQSTGYPWWSVVAMYLDSADVIDNTNPPAPVKNGWVAFGDSYAAGIGAGAAVDVPDDEKCWRGNGGYPWKLQDTLQLVAHGGLNFQRLPCSGNVANDIFKDDPTGQVEKWYPSSSDIATLSIIGNDFKFGPIVTLCIVGWKYKTDPTCEEVLAAAEALLAPGDDTIATLLYDVWSSILKKSVRPQFTIYQTGYPQFFQNSDNTCNTNRFWVGKLGVYWYGEYLTRNFRSRLNELSYNVNAKIEGLINAHNANLPRPDIVFVQPDITVYPTYRYCENSRTEPLEGASQDQVAFFYPLGKDYAGPDAVVDNDGWGTSTVSSADCKSLVLDSWVEDMLCEIAVEASTNSTMLALLEANSDDSITAWSIDANGDVTITEEKNTDYIKMFHPKSFYNAEIAFQVYLALIEQR